MTLSSSELPDGKLPLRIASYNVGKFKSWEHLETQYDISEFLKNNETNIICFQEYRENTKITADTLSRLLNCPQHAITYLSGSTTLGTGIFSKYPILRFGKIPLDSQTNDAMWVDIQTGETTTRIISCHLQTTNFSRKWLSAEISSFGQLSWLTVPSASVSSRSFSLKGLKAGT